MAELISIRVGIRVPLFPNLGVVVTKVSEQNYESLTGCFLLITTIVPELAGKLVLEKR